MALDYTWIIDDDAIFTFTIKKLLIKNLLTNRIDSFVNGQQAIDKLNDFRAHKTAFPNVILLDINMPILDGWQFLNEYAEFEEKKNTVVYLVSSSIDPRDREKAALYKDIQDFVVKPVTLDALTSLMHKAEVSMNIS